MTASLAANHCGDWEPLSEARSSRLCYSEPKRSPQTLITVDDGALHGGCHSRVEAAVETRARRSATSVRRSRSEINVLRLAVRAVTIPNASTALAATTSAAG